MSRTDLNILFHLVSPNVRRIGGGKEVIQTLNLTPEMTMIRKKKGKGTGAPSGSPAGWALRPTHTRPAGSQRGSGPATRPDSLFSSTAGLARKRLHPVSSSSHPRSTPKHALTPPVTAHSLAPSSHISLVPSSPRRLTSAPTPHPEGTAHVFTPAS